MKLELVLKKKLLQSGCELAPEDATQRGDRQEESSRGRDPSGTIGCKTASRNNFLKQRLRILLQDEPGPNDSDTRLIRRPTKYRSPK